MKAGKKSREELLTVFLKKYRTIMQSCDEAVLERIKWEEDYYESFDWFCRLMEGKDPDAIIEQMDKANIEVECILARIDRAIDEYGRIAREEGFPTWRQYDALYSVYFSSQKIKIKEIARKYGVKKSTIYEDIKNAKIQLFHLLFDDHDTGYI